MDETLTPFIRKTFEVRIETGDNPEIVLLDRIPIP